MGIMTRRASHAPMEKLHDMTRTWTNPRDTDGEQPGEITSGGLTYTELCKLHDVGRDWTDTSVKLDRVDQMNYRAPAFGRTCPNCFVQRSVSGDCMC